MRTVYVPPSEGPPRSKTPDHHSGTPAENRPVDVVRRDRPRTQPPHFRPPPPPSVYQPRSLFERFLPPLFVGLLVLLFAGSIAFLLWAPSQDEYDLSPEELQLLSEATRAQSRAPASRPGDERDWDRGAAPNGNRNETRGLTSNLESGSAILYVDTTPSGALVSIGGEIAGVTPLRLDRLPARRHVVTLDRPGFNALDTLIALDADAPTTLSLALIPLASPAPAVADSEDDASPPPDTRRDAPQDARRDDARTEASPPPAPTTGSIRVRVSPARVPVQLDGQTVGVAPLDIDDVPAGTRTLTAFLPGYESATVRVYVEPGGRETVEITLVPQTGTLAVVVRPWGSIYIDGVLHARDTDLSFEATLPPGRHQVRVVHPELGAQERTVEVLPDRTTSAVFDLN